VSRNLATQRKLELCTHPLAAILMPGCPHPRVAVGRNDPRNSGSGKKYEKCCLSKISKSFLVLFFKKELLPPFLA
jgi:hypothetical protein